MVESKTKKTSRQLETSNKSELIGRSIYKNGDRDPQGVVPKSKKTSRFRAHHLEVGHGLEKTRRETPEKYKKPSVYNEGDYVKIRDLRVKTDENTKRKLKYKGKNVKFKPRYKGPYVVAKCLGNNRYVVKDIPGFNQTARPLDTILSSDKFKPWIRAAAPD